MLNEETNLQSECFLAIGSRTDALIWRQHVGAYRSMDNPKRIIKVGTPGMSDACMIVQCTITSAMLGKTVGIAVQPEFKTTKGKQADSQKKWEKAVSKVGAIYALIHSPSELVGLVEKIKRGEW